MLWLLLLPSMWERMGMLQELCSEMLLLAGKPWPPSLPQDVCHWDREMPESRGQMKSTAEETTDVRAFWTWCGGQEPLVLHIQLDGGSSSKNGICPKVGSRQKKKKKKLKPPPPPPPKCSGVGGTSSSWVGGELALWPFCFFTS